MEASDSRPRARRIVRDPNTDQYLTDQSLIEKPRRDSSAQTPSARVTIPRTAAGRTRTADPGLWRQVAAEASIRRRDRQEHARTLVERAAWLPPDDRELVEAVFGEGISVAAFVRRRRQRGNDLAPGRREQDRAVPLTARTARTRLRRLVERVLSPRYAFVVANRALWTGPMRRAAFACVVQGLSLREASARLGMSLHAVRRHLDAVDALFTAHAEQTHAGAPRGGRP
jgi:hypothetical protein